MVEIFLCLKNQEELNERLFKGVFQNQAMAPNSLKSTAITLEFGLYFIKFNVRLAKAKYLTIQR